jgi:glycosyltransferase involved in cell wall biosynthesis
MMDSHKISGGAMSKNVVVNYTGRKGGGALYSYEMTKSLVENGCNVYAIISEDVENISEWKKLNLRDLIVIPTYASVFEYMINTVKFMFSGRKKLKNSFKNISIDTVYIPMISPWTSLINSIFKNAQVIVTVHDPKPHSGANSYISMKCERIAKQADDIVILSEAFREYSVTAFKKDKEHIHVIPHGIFNYYKNIPNQVTSVEYNENSFNFLFFGRITKYKGLHVLSKAYKRLYAEFENITLTIAGNGSFEEYKEEYDNLKNVTIINRWIKDEEVGSFFTGNRIISVLPYTDASQSGVIPIAMEYKSLVIASDTGGLSEQVKHGSTGYLFKANDENELYETMKFSILNYDKQNGILQNAVDYIRSLSWDVLGGKLIEVIK